MKITKKVNFYKINLLFIIFLNIKKIAIMTEKIKSLFQKAKIDVKFMNAGKGHK